jgi:hypothetical protein
MDCVRDWYTGCSPSERLESQGHKINGVWLVFISRKGIQDEEGGS